MFAIVDQWQPVEIILLAAVGAAALIAWHWRRVQLALVEADLKREALRKGMSLEEIGELLQLSSKHVETCTDEEAVGKLAECLIAVELPGDQIEEVMAAVHRADSSTKHATCQTAWNMVHADNADCIDQTTLREQVHAAIRGLLRPTQAEAESPSAEA